MSNSLLRRGAMFALCGWLAVSATASAADRPADKILDEINALETPQLSPQDRSSQAKVQAYFAAMQKAAEKKAVLIGELYKAAPETPELTQLMPERWQARSTTAKLITETKNEIDEILSKSKNEKLVAEAAFTKVALAFRSAPRNAKPETLSMPVEEFVAKYPKDIRCATVLGALASRMTDEAKKEELNNRVLKDYPDSREAKPILAERKMREAVGKPFVLAFTEAIKGSEVSIAGLKGKVVIIDFWATWCGPCVAEMPNMKKLYAEYKDKGVEFIGVSLDQPKEKGGLDKLKEFVAKNDIQWPQYYQGNFWQSEFSSSWGINSIPCVFAVDADGNLASVEARGKLETMIPELLEKAEKAKKTVAKP